MGTDTITPRLPASMHFIERDWLSANQVLFFDGEGADARATLVDSGYVKHAALTVSLVRHVLARRGLPLTALTRIVNTHLHSDHCGGNAALAEATGCRISVPAPDFDAVARWDEHALTYLPTGQRCARFTAHDALSPGDELMLGGQRWQLLAAPGHAPHGLILYCPALRGLLSADALWENGFGVIFPELEGDSGFAEQQAVLDLIRGLAVDWVIPGHGPMFTDVGAALATAQSRLDAMRGHPTRHARNGIKVLVKYYLLDVERMRIPDMIDALRGASSMAAAASQLGMTLGEALTWAAGELVKQGELARDGEFLVNA